MKSIYPILIVGILLISTIGAFAQQSDLKNKDTTTKGDRAFTHTVFAEAGVLSTCPYSPYANNALDNIYKSGDYPFYYTCLVDDLNSFASERLWDYNLFNYPTVFFDGGYKVTLDGVNPEAEYGYNIEQCGNRTVKDVDVTLNVVWLGDATMDIIASVKNNEATQYDGRIRVYVTEIVSSLGWIDYNQHLYTFPFLNFAFDQDLTLPAGNTWTDSTTWDGHNYHYDSHNFTHTFGAIQYGNIMVIAVLSNSEWHQGYAYPPSQNPFDAYYVDDTTGFFVGPTNTPPSTPTINGQTNGKINVEYTYTTSATDPQEDQVYYWFDWGDDTNSGWIGPYNSGATANAKHTWTVKGTYTVSSKAKDIYDAESDWATLEVTMPRARAANAPFLLKLLERSTHAFPILWHLIGLYQ